MMKVRVGGTWRERERNGAWGHLSGSTKSSSKNDPRPQMGPIFIHSGQQPIYPFT